MKKQRKPVIAKGFSVTQLALEFGCTGPRMRSLLKDTAADMKVGGKPARYSLRAIIYPLTVGVKTPSGLAPGDMSPIDRLNTIRAEREELKLFEEMGKLGEAEDWDTQAAEAMKSLGNSLDGLPDLLTEGLGLDDLGFETCERVVDSFRNTLYNNLILGDRLAEESNDD